MADSALLKPDPLRIVCAQADDLPRYIDLLEELADWLCARGIDQWPRGRARTGKNYYAKAIANGEVHLAFVGDEFAGAIRLLDHDSIVWPEIAVDDALYVYNLAVSRAWAGHRVGRRLLEWAERRTADTGRQF